jgi:transcriptional antiterminator RfaH
LSLNWYALRSKPNREVALWLEAEARGFEVYLPRTRVRPVNPRARIVKPWFPGYMFIHTDVKATGFSALAWLPYSIGIVCCGGEAAPIPDALIEGIRRRVEEFNDAPAQPFDGLQRGDAVDIVAGPFAGYAALFDGRLSGSDRVRVLLSALNRYSKQQMPLDLPGGYIRRRNRL